MTTTAPTTIDLDALYADGLAAAEAIAAAQAREHERRHADAIRQARNLATTTVREALSLEIPGDAWEETDLGGASTVLAVDLGDRHGIELRLAFRHRGYTEGGNVLTVIALAPAEGVWVGSRYTIVRPSDVPGVVDDAIAMAEAWDEAAAAEEAGEIPQGEPSGPAVRIEGDTLEAVLARTIIELVRPMVRDLEAAIDNR